VAEQYLSTGRLENVLHLIELGKQTGILKAIHAGSPLREQGQIVYHAGKPIEASVGRLTGAAALSVMQSWDKALYLFEESPVKPAPTNIGQTPAVGHSAPASPPPPVTAPLPPTPPAASLRPQPVSSLPPSQMLRRVPRPTTRADSVDQHRLDRQTRMVLLLVDGQRTVDDLARLIHRSPDDIVATLNALSALQLIE